MKKFLLGDIFWWPVPVLRFAPTFCEGNSNRKYHIYAIIKDDDKADHDFNIFVYLIRKSSSEKQEININLN